MKDLRQTFRNISCCILLLLLNSLSASAQELKVSGKVFDSNGETIIGASVILKDNKAVGTVTDFDGNFTLTVPNDKAVLIVSYVGMKSKEIKASPNAIKVTLEDDSQVLEEMVVVGYGQQKKASVVGAITQTNGKVLQRTGGVSDLGSALTGNLPGVITTSSTGMPGEEDPNIVIRGVGTWNDSSPLVLVDGVERPMSSVDINSVESISVLKDASATAVYGVKGANGVILITTKRGNEGKATISGGGSIALKTVSKLPNKLDSYDTYMLRNKAIVNELGISPDSWSDYLPQDIINKYRYPSSLEESEQYPNVDWDDWLFKNAASSENAYINVSGGTSFVKYYASIDYQHEGDLFKSYDNGHGYSTDYAYNRVNMRSNLDFQLTKTTKLSVNLAGSYGVKHGPRTDFEYTIWDSAYNTSPAVMMPIYSDGSYGYDPINQQTNSVYVMSTSGQNTRTTTRLNTDFTLEQDLSFWVKGLKAKASISWDNLFYEYNRGVNADDTYQRKYISQDGTVSYESSTGSYGYDWYPEANWTTEGGTVDNSSTERNLYYTAQLDYARTFGQHTVTLMGLFSRQERTRGSIVPVRREDWAFRGTYNFANKYFVEYNGAYNGSDKFSNKYRFAFFNSGGLGYMISEEKFMNFSKKWLDMLKLRVSYGEIGNDSLGDEFDDSQRWLYLTQWAYDEGSSINTGLYQSKSPYYWYREATVGNEDVHWETMRKLNFGLDFSFLGGMFVGTVDVFRDYRSDILIAGSDRAIPSYFGGTLSAPYANLGKTRTRGYELQLRFNKTFNYSGVHIWADMNMTHAISKVIFADDGELLPDYQKSAGKTIGQSYTYVDSGFYNTMDQLYGSTEWSTLDDQKLPGGYFIIDYNGDGVIDTYDNIPYGYSGTPQNTYSGSFGVDWKGFSFFVQLYGVNNVTRQVVFTSFSQQNIIAYDDGKTLWSAGNTASEVPLPRWGSSTNDYYYGSRYFYDGSYIRLKNVEIAYTFTKGWIKTLGISELKLYVNGNNLWTWTRMPDDRESNFAGTGWASQGAYPTVRRFNFGLKFTL
ncbi:MAG: TonB-dependent receptor [Prevotella sp.]|nr:TonB-dependent receptor [Prevotella sp.]